ncbi:MAG: hypothetical protein AAB649_07690 [Patescibacteria group bacterium]
MKRHSALKLKSPAISLAVGYVFLLAVMAFFAALSYVSATEAKSMSQAPQRPHMAVVPSG